MKVLYLLVLLCSTSLAAVGQLLFRLGAKRAVAPLDFVNLAVLSGIACYGFSTILWIWALSRAPLTLVYPFTMLTFVLVYLGSAMVLGERPPLQAIMGLGLILCGLLVVASARSVAA